MNDLHEECKIKMHNVATPKGGQKRGYMFGFNGSKVADDAEVRPYLVVPATPGSLRLDVGSADHPAPFLGLVRHQLAEGGG